MGRDHLIAKICRISHLALLVSHQVSRGGGLPLDEQGKDKASFSMSALPITPATST